MARTDATTTAPKITRTLIAATITRSHLATTKPLVRIDDRVCHLGANEERA
jgi:hypothetical protein